MDLGLGNLSELKTHLLNEGLRSQTRFDAALADLGRGVAAQFEGYCNRRLGRLVGDTFECPADREFVILPRYPVEELTRVELRESLRTGWVDQGAVEAVVAQLSERAGIVQLAEPLTAPGAQLRFTYSAGYWYPTSGIPPIKAGTIQLATGSEAAAVDFGAPFGSLPFVFLRPRLPGAGTLIECAATAVRRGGFSVELGAPASAGLEIDWFALATSSRENGLELGSVALAAGHTEYAVAFAESYAAAPLVFASLRLPAGAGVIGCVPAAVTGAGFTARFAAPIPVGTQLSWLAVDPDTLLADDIGRLQGEHFAAAGAEAIVIGFEQEFAAPPTVFPQLITADGTIIATAATAVSESGFEIALGAPAPAGSHLVWLALPATVGEALALPEGATALPADLKLAWLLQCEHLWRLRDPLGTAIASEETQSPALPAAQLVPEVERTLKTYRRYALS